ncbi:MULTISPECIES: hypothetical protein [Pseudomonas syringae group]|uniref:hypothetical protein n=1 Tax=Pseudomonas syringae group TaxID=136849 RepID=UPI000EFDBC85|nr:MULTISPECIES: hypothetical protein [Pseudomonas syringae group]QIQ72091.1 hypothetical protein HBB04_02484 [Pseudomonas coronafaciens]RMN99233.1 hypothetical protein ALQ50_00695 [Pseudomonas coronafaciens pv. coronafaciens]
MNILKQIPLLTVADIGSATSALDATHSRILKTIKRLQDDVEARRVEIKSRWAKTRQANLIGADANALRSIELQEMTQAFDGIKQTAAAELDQLFKEAGASHALVLGQRPYYDSPVRVVARAGLGSDKRTAYALQLQGSLKAELSHLGQVAVGTGDEVLAAAVLSRIDRLPREDRPFSANELASAMRPEAFLKVQEYIKIAETRFQGVVIAIRAWNSGRKNPLSTVSLALRQGELDEQLLKELENADRKG